MRPKFNYVKKTGKFNAARKISLQQQHGKFKETKVEAENLLTPMFKSFSHTKDGCIQQTEQKRLNLCTRNIGVLIMCDAIKYKAWKLAKSHNVI
jgi:hypothetical protein